MSDLEPARGSVWRHKKRGGIYEIVDNDAAVQISNSLFTDVAVALEEERWVAYRPVNGHRLFFRMAEEFLDGRFEKVAAPE